MSPAPRPGLREVGPYQAPQLQVRARLNTNECPYPLPEGFADDLARAVRELPLHRYPDREATRLREALAEAAGHVPEGTWVANGSNEILLQLLLAYGGPGRRALVFPPTYLLHERIAWIAHTEVERVPLGPGFLLTAVEVDRALELRPDLAFVCSPNNPTGNAQPLAEVERLAAGLDGLVIVDQAYVEFGGESAVPLLARHANVVVVRTFSKAFAMAGARVGYCLAAPEVVDDLRRVRLPYHISALAQAAALVGLRHRRDSVGILGAVRAQRDRIVAALRAMAGVTCFPSDANFVLFRPPRPAGEVFRGLLDRGVLVRDLSEVVQGCLRVTAGTPAEVDLFLEALEEVLTT